MSAAIFLNQPVGNLDGVVRAAIVDNNHFKILIRLLDHGFDGFRQKVAIIKARDDHRNQRRGGLISAQLVNLRDRLVHFLAQGSVAVLLGQGFNAMEVLD